MLWEIFAHPQGEPGDVQRDLLEPAIAAPEATAPTQIALHRVGSTTYLHGALQDDAFYPPRRRVGLPRAAASSTIDQITLVSATIG